jgi:hypothetical protein
MGNTKMEETLVWEKEFSICFMQMSKGDCMKFVAEKVASRVNRNAHSQEHVHILRNVHVFLNL